MGELLLDLFPPAPPSARAEAARKLAACRNPRTVGALRSVLERDESLGVRAEAARALASTGSPDAVGPLVDALRRDEPSAVRTAAMAGLVSLGFPEPVKRLVLGRDQPEVMRLEALAILGEPALSTEELKELAADPSPNLSRLAARALSDRLPPPLATPADPGGTSGDSSAGGDRSPPTVVPPAIAGAEPADPGTALVPEAPAEDGAEGEGAPQVAQPGPGESPNAPADDPVAAEEPPAEADDLVDPRPSDEGLALGLPAVPSPDSPLTLDGPDVPVEEEPVSGVPLTVTTSTLAGASLMSFVSLLGQQESPGVLMLVGSAGAIIGGGTAWGLSRFGLTFDPMEAAWYTNVTAWGTLAGLTAYAGSDLGNYKAEYGLLIAGETLGIAAGIWSARQWEWTPGEVVFANTLLAGQVLTLGGARRLQGKPFEITRAAAIGTVPAMVLSATAARLIDPSEEDLHLMGVAASTLAWGGALVGSGDANEKLLGRHGLGGAMVGLGAGYLGTTLAAAFTDVDPGRTWGSTLAMATGNLLGYGVGMVLEPEREERWKLSTGLGGLALQAAAFGLYDYIDPGPEGFSMTMTGAFLGASSWGIASAAGHLGETTEADKNRLKGGLLAGTMAGGLAGFVSSMWFEPDGGDQLLSVAATELGALAGIGAAKLAADRKGAAETLGSLAGSAAGFAMGAVTSHYLEPSGADVWASTVGASYGFLVGGLLPTLSEPEWRASRPTEGGALLGLTAGAWAAGAASHLAGAGGAQVNVPALAGLLGLGIGTGAGLMLPEPGSRPARVGAVIGLPAMAAASLAAEPWLKLHEGLGPEAAGLASTGLLLGAAYGVMGAGIADDSGLMRGAEGRQLAGGALMGGSAGLAAGLALSKFFEPDAEDYPLALAGTTLGAAFGSGASQLRYWYRGRNDSVGLLSGALGGLAAGSLAARYLEPRDADKAALLSGLAYGALVGTLAPTLGEPSWSADRLGRGGALVGLSVGAVGAAAASRLTEASTAQVTVPTVAGLLGLGAGLGAGLAVDPPSGQAARIGTVAGILSFQGGSLALDRWLHLSDGLSGSARLMAADGALLGAAHGLSAAGLFSRGGRVGDLTFRQGFGGMLAGASVGTASGLVLSRFFAPDAEDAALATSASALGGAFGLGLSQLALATPGRAESAGLLLGSASGLAAGAAAAHFASLTRVDVLAGAVGLGYGALAGTLLPTLDEVQWDGARRARGGALVGLSVGAAGAAAASHLAGADEASLAVPTVAGLFGLGAGLGAGLAWPSRDLRAARIGTVAGLIATPAAALLAEPKLRLAEGLGDDAGGFGALGGAIGASYGLLLAGAADPSGLVGETPERQKFGGALFGGSVGVASGLVLSRFLDLEGPDGAVLTGSAALGGALGRGASMLLSGAPGRPDTLAALGTSALALAGAGLVQRHTPLERQDGTAALTGMSFGAFLGGLAPSLAEPRLEGGRRTTGGLLLGLAAGAFGGAALRHVTGASHGEVFLTGLGGLDGLLTGLGAGMLVDEPGTRPERIGAFAGAVAGLGLGAGLWPQLRPSRSDLRLVRLSTALGGWYGLFAPTLGHADSTSFAPYAMSGGALAGAGAASLAATVAIPFVELEDDALDDATVGFLMASGAGAGLGALASRRDDVPLGAMLAAGAAGLAVSGALHDSLDLSFADAPLFTLASAEGLWFGGWLPYLLHPEEEVTGRQVVGSVAGVSLAAATGAWLASPWIEVSGREAGLAGLASALTSSMAGGLALMEPALHGRAGKGLLLAGTAAGLGGGLFLAPRIELDDRALAKASLGALLGTSEALAFAWAGRASKDTEWTGAALFGAGLGTTLGLAASAYPHFTAEQAPAAAGFAAWGAWIGSFSAAFANPERHDVTLGGLLGANLGFIGGYGLLRTGVIEGRDIGWLSLFGGAGTLLGAGTGAAFASKDDPRPAFLGSALGPVAGLAAGGILLPKLRSLSERARPAPRKPAARRVAPDEPEPELAERLLGKTFAIATGIVDVAPLVGALPSPFEGAEAPMVFGVSGRIR